MTLPDATGLLRAAGIDNPAREARLLLALAQGRCGALPDPAIIPAGFASLVARRAAREPMALLRGRQGFWTLDLAVSSATLCPRADSETLIEAALAARPDRLAVRRILDLGTGTGALLLAALSEYWQAWGIGVDIEPAACRLAACNARATGLPATIVCGDWASCVDGRWDLVLANPPYIPSGDLAGLMPEVARHEPARALDGGPDGLAAYRRIAPALPRLLAPGGCAVLELGAGLSEAVRPLLVAAGLGDVHTRADLAGIPRAIVAFAAHA